MITRGKYRTRREHLLYWLLGFVVVFDAMVTIMSLGFLACDFHATILFSEWYDKLGGLE